MLSFTHACLQQSLTHFMALVFFCTPWKHQKISDTLKQFVGFCRRIGWVFLRFSNVFRGYTKRPVTWNEFTKVTRYFDKKSNVKILSRKELLPKNGCIVDTCLAEPLFRSTVSGGLKRFYNQTRHVASRDIMQLTLPATSILESYIKIRIDLNFYFHTPLWCLRRFYEGLYKTFWGTTKKCENRNLR